MTIWHPTIRRNQRPVYSAIAAAIEADVLGGRLRPGERLPTHRALSTRLGVTVGTVSRAYEAARASGWISGEVGRGTFVLDRRSGRFPNQRDEKAAIIDLSLNSPVESVGPDLSAALRALSIEADVSALLRYAPSDGIADRAAGASLLERHGLSVDPDRIVLCAGAQHGIGAALDTVARPGDAVLAEELTYPAFRPIAEARGLRVGPIRLDRHGMLPDALESACRKFRPKALYVVPTLQNPTTVTLSEGRRRAVVEVARRYGVVIIEDDIHRLLAPDAPAPLAALAPERTVHIASLSKTFVAGLRIAYLAAPRDLRDGLADAIWRSMWALPPLTVALATRWIRSNEILTVSAAKRREAFARQALATRLLPRTHLQATGAAYHVWLQTRPLSAETFTERARAAGVAVTPGYAFYVGSGSAPSAVRVSLSAATDRAVLADALDRLRQILLPSRSRSATGLARMM